MDINSIYKLFKECTHLTTDGREVSALCDMGHKVIFVALKGDNFDGNKYANQAINDGAIYAIVSDDRLRNDYRYIHVSDTLKTLQALAHHHRRSIDATIITITGSNGKTTTKELMHAVLSKKYRCSATIGNLNNHIGVPLTLLKIEEDTEIAIVELGANHQKEIAMLAGIAAPDYGMITNIGKAHLDGFGGEDGVMDGKGELFDYIAATNGTIIYNSDIEKIKTLADRYPTTKKIEYHSDNIEYCDKENTLCVRSEDFRINTHLVGSYNLFNIAAAYAIGQLFDVEKRDIIEAIEEYTPSNKRSQLMVTGTNNYIMDAYNANPSSMTLALENLTKLDASNSIAILGDMKELGEYSQEEHINIIKLVEKLDIKRVIYVGNEFKNALAIYQPLNNYKLVENQSQAKDEILNIENSTILIKGSNSTQLYKIIE